MSKYRSQFFRFSSFITRFFSFWFFILIGLIGIVVAIFDKLTTIPFFKDQTPLVTVTLLATLLIYIVIERAKVLEEILSLLQASRVKIYRNQETAYLEAAKTIAQVSGGDRENKTILVAALHGQRRKPSPAQPHPAFEIFDSALKRCANSTGPDMWQMREIINVTEMARFEMILKRLKETQSAEGLEIRAFCLENAFPQMSPLIIGSEDVLFGIDDAKFYRVRGAIHLQGSECVKMATEFFDSLWTDDRIIKLRSACEVDWDQVDALKNEIELKVGKKAS